MITHLMYREHNALSERCERIRVRYLPGEYFDVWMDVNNGKFPFVLMSGGIPLFYGDYQAVDSVLEQIESNPEFREQMFYRRKVQRGNQ